ncbi:N-acetyltransferase [Glutamicibacter sp. JC586]|uniref:GNAT family N-acetyltransferase n=1 Tax=Glutamicibacter sp. JC586 TaxID=2590552 RepID=UPI00135B01D5|nr:GNAT family N-acetyltransferase [Glutamicibacter sp. JC586]
MPLTLLPLTAEQFPLWMKRSIAEYVADLVATGVTPDKAENEAERTMADAFPSAQPTETNTVFVLEHQELGDVGYLWIGHDTSGDPTSWWVWDIVVDAEHRGLGFGKQAMQLAEDYSKSHGARTLGLNVFGFNHVARGLYESLGFETTSVKMRKTL